MSKLGLKILILVATLVAVLFFTLLIIGVGPVRHRGPWRISPVDMAHWFGWASGVLLGVSAAYSALKRGFPGRIRLWLAVHCIPGLLSLAMAGVHLINKILFARPGHLLSFFTFGLMIVIVLGGILGRYVKRPRVIREYWRTLHIPLTAIFYFMLSLHVLTKTGVL